MIFWFTGKSRSGKTTITKGLKELFPNAIILDGDEMRESISLGAGFSKRERKEHNLRVARLAGILHKQNHLVLVAVIAPFADVRCDIAEIIPRAFWIHVDNPRISVTLDRPYEDPEIPALKINTFSDLPTVSIRECYSFIRDIYR